MSNVISVSRLLNVSSGWLSALCEMRSSRFSTATSPLSVNSVLPDSRDSLPAFPPPELPVIDGTIRSSDSLKSFACLTFGACWAYSEPDRLDGGWFEELEGLTGCFEDMMCSANGPSDSGSSFASRQNETNDVAFQYGHTLGRIRQLQSFGAQYHSGRDS